MTVGEGEASEPEPVERPRSPIEYCALRIVPDIERGECVNVGVLLICRPTRFLGVRIHVDPARLAALWPDLYGEALETIEAHLALIPAICAGEPAGGPIAGLSLRERWHWLTAPASTVVQAGPVHTGLSHDAADEIERLFRRLVVGAGERRTG